MRATVCKRCPPSGNPARYIPHVLLHFASFTGEDASQARIWNVAAGGHSSFQDPESFADTGVFSYQDLIQLLGTDLNNKQSKSWNMQLDFPERGNCLQTLIKSLGDRPHSDRIDPPAAMMGKNQNMWSILDDLSKIHGGKEILLDLLATINQPKEFRHDTYCMGTAAGEFNLASMQKYFSHLTCEKLFRPLMRAFNGLRAVQKMEFEEFWLSVEALQALELSPLMATITSLYMEAARGNYAGMLVCLSWLKTMGFMQGQLQHAIPCVSSKVVVWDCVVKIAAWRLKQIFDGEQPSLYANLLDQKKQVGTLTIHNPPTLFDRITKRLQKAVALRISSRSDDEHSSSDSSSDSTSKESDSSSSSSS